MSRQNARWVFPIIFKAFWKLKIMRSSRKGYKAGKSKNRLLKRLVSKVMRGSLIHASTIQTNEDFHSPRERSSYYAWMMMGISPNTWPSQAKTIMRNCTIAQNAPYCWSIKDLSWKKSKRTIHSSFYKKKSSLICPKRYKPAEISWAHLSMTFQWGKSSSLPKYVNFTIVWVRY